MKPKFDGYAAQYDAWFMENDNLFQSELRLFQRALGDISGQRVLSVGCGSGLFESMIDHSGIEGIEPSRDMGAIAQKRGVNVIAFGAIEDADLEENAYDAIYLNGSSSHMEGGSYTHLTLPTIYPVYLSEVAGSLKKKKYKN